MRDVVKSALVLAAAAAANVAFADAADDAAVKRGVAALCIGGGEGIALAVELV